MGKQFYQDYQVTFNDCDVTGQFKLPQLVSLLLEVSAQQSKNLGLGDEVLFKRYNLIWIVTDYDMTITRLPALSEHLRLETEALSYNRLFCYRRFSIFDEDHQEIVQLIATFALIDFDERKLQTVPEDLIKVYEATKSKKLLRGPKYHSIETPMCQSYQVSYFDLDLNGHVNNSRYLEWLYANFDLDFLRQHYPKKLHLHFNKEVYYGQAVESCLVLDNNLSRHEIRVNGQVHAQAQIEWKERT